MSETVVKIEHLWKRYRLGVIGHGTLTHDLQSWWARWRGLEDPNLRLDQINAAGGEQVEGDRFWALRDINPDVHRGEVLGVIGRNGAGKSTLLKILSRVTTPTRGAVRVKGRIASLLEVGTGFHKELTGRENIYLNGAILGMRHREVTRKFDEIAGFAEIDEFLDTPVKRYSSGMYVRLAFAVAAHLEPEILVVDEVLAVGDAAFQKKCLNKMENVAQQGRTVFFVSHNMAAIKNLCSRSILIEKGKIVADGKTEKTVDLYIEEQGNRLKTKADFPVSNGNMKILDVFTVNRQKKRQNEFACAEEIRVVFAYQILNGKKEYVFAVKLYDEDQNLIFLSRNDQELDKGLCYIEGRYESICHVPKKLLNAGKYAVTAMGISNRMDKEIVVEGACQFEVVEMEKEYPRSWKWLGIIKPDLNWDTVHLEDREIDGEMKCRDGVKNQDCRVG